MRHPSQLKEPYMMPKVVLSKIARHGHSTYYVVFARPVSSVSFLVFSITSFGDHNHPEHQETTPSRFDTTLELGETGGTFNASIGL